MIDPTVVSCHVLRERQRANITDSVKSITVRDLTEAGCSSGIPTRTLSDELKVVAPIPTITQPTIQSKRARSSAIILNSEANIERRKTIATKSLKRK